MWYFVFLGSMWAMREEEEKGLVGKREKKNERERREKKNSAKIYRVLINTYFALDMADLPTLLLLAVHLECSARN